MSVCIIECKEAKKNNQNINTAIFFSVIHTLTVLINNHLFLHSHFLYTHHTYITLSLHINSMFYTINSYIHSFIHHLKDERMEKKLLCVRDNKKNIAEWVDEKRYDDDESIINKV
jgi:hypothetical protein